MTVPDDEILIQQYQQGEEGAFGTLFQRYHAYVYKVLIRKGVPGADAEDFTQDLFLKLTTALRHFAGRSTFKTYLDRSITHKLIDFYRQQHASGLRRPTELLDLLELAPPAPSVSRSFSQTPASGDLEQSLHNCLAKLRSVARRAVLALWLDGFKLRQIAEILALPQGTVTSHLARGRVQLRQCLEHELGHQLMRQR